MSPPSPPPHTHKFKFDRFSSAVSLKIKARSPKLIKSSSCPIQICFQQPTSLRDILHTPMPTGSTPKTICPLPFIGGHIRFGKKIYLKIILILYWPRHKKSRFFWRNQQRCRSACAFVHSDQHLLYSLSGKYNYYSLICYRETSLKQPLKNRQNKNLNDKW